MDWKTRIEPALPYWEDYAPLLEKLGGGDFPSCADLNRMLPANLLTASGQPVRFRPAGELPDTPYEQRIHATGEVSTRPDSWHDLFNALVWARMPNIKVAMNARHCSGSPVHTAGSRGPLRDAITLFDECGVIVASSHREFLEALARKEWKKVFRTRRALWNDGITVVITGHAMLEKLLDPYKSMTANALLIHTGHRIHSRPREARLAAVDAAVAANILENEMLNRPGCLSPLPLMGIPGWWTAARQDEGFYTDLQVFRPPREGTAPIPVHEL
jgi:hypothetical protein